MAERLFVGVLGHRDAGKSTTWNTLFGATVRTGQYPRTLNLFPGECAEVFLISGSPEERGLYAGDILANQACRIVLCSMQYRDGPANPRLRRRGGVRLIRPVAKPWPE